MLLFEHDTMQLIFERGNHRTKVLDAKVITDKKYNSVYIDESVINALEAAQQLDKIDQATMIIHTGYSIWEITGGIPSSNVGIASVLYTLEGQIIMEGNDFVCTL
jgi:hypothetical protein